MEYIYVFVHVLMYKVTLYNIYVRKTDKSYQDCQTSINNSSVQQFLSSVDSFFRYLNSLEFIFTKFY